MLVKTNRRGIYHLVRADMALIRQLSAWLLWERLSARADEYPGSPPSWSCASPLSYSVMVKSVPRGCYANAQAQRWSRANQPLLLVYETLARSFQRCELLLHC